ncbi:MAG: hypothetical protein ACT6FE_01015 [Methanosarcinaceae archaeon]
MIKEIKIKLVNNFNKRKVNLKIVNMFLFLIIVLCVVFYVVEANNLVVKGFKLQELRKEVRIVNDKKIEYKLDIMSLESYNNLSRRAKDIKMIAVGSIDYISIDREMAKR